MSDAPAFRQLPLALRLDDSATFDNFYLTPDNGLALETARGAACGKDSGFIFGPPGSGRSHLLQAACHACEGSALYLPLAELAGHEAAFVLEGCGNAALLALDDVDAVVASASWAEQLFHTLNRLRDAGGVWLAAGGVAPRRMVCALADLRSRLEWSPAVHVAALDDERRGAALRWRARGRGLELGEEAARYILNRYSRDPRRLFALLDVLDRRSLEHRRRLSVAFVREIMAEERNDETRRLRRDD